MTNTVSPADERELEAIVAEAAAHGAALAVEGGGTRRGLGRPVEADTVVSTAAMSGITLYEPAELVMAAKAGTPLDEVETALAGNRQRLAFEPMDHRGMFGSKGHPTIGAVAAANISGPRRIESGAARDSLIGVRAVTGRGETIKSGGRVMKNVAGYDLVKFLAGSFGTLAVITEVTFKVAPMPETERSLIVSGLDASAAVAVLSAGLGSPFSVSGAAHLPSPSGAPSLTALRIEGFEDSVGARMGKLRSVVGAPGDADIRDEAASKDLWASVRDLTSLAGESDAPLWRVSVKPGDSPAVAKMVGERDNRALLFDWGGGLVWIAGAGADAGVMAVRAAAGAAGGHATLVRAGREVRARVAVFEPLAPPAMTLTKQLKQAFDPGAILNPGRMYMGI